MGKTFLSEKLDKELFKVISVCEAFAKARQVNLEIDEVKIINANKFIYYFTNTKSHLKGYIGRENGTNSVVFMITDNGRLNWALAEGFSRQEAFDLVGVFRKAKGLNNFMSFMLGDAQYRLEDGVVKSK